ncbi:MAG: hypothetical protein AAF630_13770, partial [Cyanobacteria bacterium P01_C01_bin.38]
SCSLDIHSEQDARTTKLYFCKIGMLPQLLMNHILLSSRKASIINTMPNAQCPMPYSQYLMPNSQIQ